MKRGTSYSMEERVFLLHDFGVFLNADFDVVSGFERFHDVLGTAKRGHSLRIRASNVSCDCLSVFDGSEKCEIQIGTVWGAYRELRWLVGSGEFLQVFACLEWYVSFLETAKQRGFDEV